MREMLMIALSLTLSLTLTTMAHAQPLDADAQASTLLERGAAAQAAQDYERAYDLHLRALWAMRAARTSLKQDTTSAQEEALVQALPHLRKQALISSGVLGWASVLSANSSSPSTLRLALFDAYDSIGAETQMEHLLPSLASKLSDIHISYKIRAAIRKMEERRKVTPSKVLHKLCWGAPVACPLMLKRQAQLATASLWPPPPYLRGQSVEVKSNPSSVADQLKALIDQGAPYDLALSASLYCQDNKATCMDLLAKGALKAKDPIMLAQARLLNLAWVFTSTSLDERFSLMWTYHTLMKESGELEQASQWLAQVGVPLLLHSRDKLPYWHFMRVAGQLFDYGLNAQAEALLNHLEQHYKKERTKDHRLTTYIQHGQLEAAVRLYEELHPLGSYVKRSDSFLTLLVSRGAVDKLPYYIDQFKPHQERYRAYAMFAWRVATDPDKPDLKLARALMNRAQVQLTPIIRDEDYLEGKVYHLKVLGVLKEHKLALNLVIDHLKAFAAKPPTDQDRELIALAGAAVESGHEDAFKLAFKLKLNIVRATRGPIYEMSTLFLGTHKLFESLVRAGRAKEFFALIDAGSDPHYQKKLADLGLYTLRRQALEDVEIDLEFFTLLRKRILAIRARGEDASQEFRAYYALCVDTKRPQLAVELSQTLTKKTNNTPALVDTEALWLVRTGAREAALSRYEQLSDEYRVRVLSHIAGELATSPQPSSSALDDLIARFEALTEALQAQLKPQLVDALIQAKRCEQAAKLLPTKPPNEQLEQLAIVCIYARKPALALELIERIDTNQGRRALALINIGYHLDHYGQSRQPEVQAILKRVAKALDAP